MVKVAKFGGSSLADAAQIDKVIKIVRADPARRYVVVSAPGKRDPKDRKITDLLYLMHRGGDGKLSAGDMFGLIADRYLSIVKDLKLALDIRPYLDGLKKKIDAGAAVEFVASRGEYLNAVIIAAALDYQFVDAAKIIWFDQRGRYDRAATERAMWNALRDVPRGAVIPGFYGSMPDGAVKTFSRGGSDITGSIVAKVIGADLYENWTDVCGILMADPRIVKGAKKIEDISYRELRELAYMGANVLHDEAVFPVKEAGITINIRNTNQPEDEGTCIVPDGIKYKKPPGTIVGIAGRRDFTVIRIEKTMMNQEIGFYRKVSEIFEKRNVSIEHMPSGIDTLSVVVSDRGLGTKLGSVYDEIEKECHPDKILVSSNIALICTVGLSMVDIPGVAAKLFGALAAAKINTRMISQGSSEISIIVGVGSSDYEAAIRAIYEAFVGKE